jgi:hypothetical protein
VKIPRAEGGERLSRLDNIENKLRALEENFGAIQDSYSKRIHTLKDQVIHCFVQ